MSRELKERSIRRLPTGVAFVSLLSLACIMLFLFVKGLPLLVGHPLWDSLTGHLRYPTSEPPEFGIFPLVMGSLAVAISTSCITVPLGIMMTAYLAEIAANRMRRIVRPFIELLAALPSVVIGFLGVVVVAPFLQDWFRADIGLNLLNVVLMLVSMSVPTICSVVEDVLFTVPRTLYEASLALGTTRWETLIRMVILSILFGIGTAVMLGMSRAIGETMVVFMVAGGAAITPPSIFNPVRPISASIAVEMVEAPFRNNYHSTLFATGIVLFLLMLLFDILAFHVVEKHRQTGSSGL